MAPDSRELFHLVLSKHSSLYQCVCAFSDNPWLLSSSTVNSSRSPFASRIETCRLYIGKPSKPLSSSLFTCFAVRFMSANRGIIMHKESLLTVTAAQVSHFFPSSPMSLCEGDRGRQDFEDRQGSFVPLPWLLLTFLPCVWQTQVLYSPTVPAALRTLQRNAVFSKNGSPILFANWVRVKWTNPSEPQRAAPNWLGSPLPLLLAV